MRLEQTHQGNSKQAADRKSTKENQQLHAITSPGFIVYANGFLSLGREIENPVSLHFFSKLK